MTSKLDEQNKIVCDTLDQQVEQLDDLTLARLKAARLKALAQLEQSKPSILQRFFGEQMMVKGALATSFSVVAVLVMLNLNSGDKINQQDVLMAMMNPVLSEDPDMLEQLEFLAWLEEQEQGQDS